MRHGWGGAVHPERCRAFQYRETLSGCKRSARPAHSVTVVWRAEGSVAVGEQVAGPAATVTPGDLDLSEPGVRVTHVAESERDRLRRQSARLGGRSTLLHFDESVDAGIEITKAHPGSLPQFITGRSTLLSNLFRDEVALRTARMAAEQITAKNVELRTARGIEAVHLAVGLAVWRLGGLECSAPVLLRPLAIRRHHSDFELKLHGSFSVNPELVRALRTHFGIDLDGDALAALAYDQGVFKPQPVIDHLRALTSGFDHFRVHPRLVVSSFADVGETMTRDCRDLDHPVLNALAGHLADREAFTARRDVPQMPHPDERPPAADTLLLDADAEQDDEGEDAWGPQALRWLLHLSWASLWQRSHQWASPPQGVTSLHCRSECSQPGRPSARGRSRALARSASPIDAELTLRSRGKSAVSGVKV